MLFYENLTIAIEFLQFYRRVSGDSKPHMGLAKHYQNQQTSQGNMLQPSIYHKEFMSR